MFQDFAATQFRAAQAESPTKAQEAAALLQRYPNLSETELARLINIYRNLTALDVALMMSDDALSPKLDRFSEDNRSKIRAPFRQYAMLLGLALVGVIVTLWALAVSS